MNRITRTVNETTVNLDVAQDRLTLVDDDRDGSLYVSQKWDSQPLGSNETVVTLKATTENGEANIALDSAQLDALMDALHHIREDYKND